MGTEVKLQPIGTRVRFSPLDGTIVGYTTFGNSDGHFPTTDYIVELDKGDYLRNSEVYIRYMIVHPSNVEVL